MCIRDRYRIELTEAVYRSAHDADLRDVAVIDANDQPVPAMLFAADTPAAGKAQQVGVPWFALPDAAELPSSELRVISERATDGRVLRVETRDITDARAPQSWLVDASALRSPVRALRLGLRTDAPVSYTHLAARIVATTAAGRDIAQGTAYGLDAGRGPPHPPVVQHRQRSGQGGHAGSAGGCRGVAQVRKRPRLGAHADRAAACLLYPSRCV